MIISKIFPTSPTHLIFIHGVAADFRQVDKLQVEWSELSQDRAAPRGPSPVPGTPTVTKDNNHQQFWLAETQQQIIKNYSAFKIKWLLCTKYMCAQYQTETTYQKTKLIN